MYEYTKYTDLFSSSNRKERSMRAKPIIIHLSSQSRRHRKIDVYVFCVHYSRKAAISSIHPTYLLSNPNNIPVAFTNSLDTLRLQGSQMKSSLLSTSSAKMKDLVRTNSLFTFLQMDDRESKYVKLGPHIVWMTCDSQCRLCLKTEPNDLHSRALIKGSKCVQRRFAVRIAGPDSNGSTL
jgi:hypothetical protein